MGHSLGKMIHSSVTLLHRLCSRQNVLHSCQESDGILEKIIIDNKLLKDGVNIGDLSLQDSERVFFEAFNLLIPHLYGEPRKIRNVEEVTVGRLYNLINVVVEKKKDK